MFFLFFIGDDFFREVLRQVVDDIGPEKMFAFLEKTNIEDITKKLKRTKKTLERLAPGRVDDNEDELYFWNTRCAFHLVF
jgi:hypothetical protein